MMLLCTLSTNQSLIGIIAEQEVDSQMGTNKSMWLLICMMSVTLPPPPCPPILASVCLKKRRELPGMVAQSGRTGTLYTEGV